jgi:hypothetical protein
MVDNFDQILGFMEFETEDQFYYLQLIKRKKENEDLGSNSKVIKNYYIKSKEQLVSKKQEITDICISTNSKAMIRLNRRSFKRVGLKALENIVNSISCEQYQFITNSYDRACGLVNSEKNKTWIVDIDKDQLPFLKDIESGVDKADPVYLSSSKILLRLESKSGVHLITRPFNQEQFQKIIDMRESRWLGETKLLINNLEIHKDNPTNLFIPNKNC